MENQIEITQTTVNKIEDAKALILNLLQERLVACGQYSQINSMYSWKGKVNNDVEFILVLKHPSETKEEVIKYLISNHPYETPEIINNNVTTSHDYFTWINDVCLR